MAYKNYFANLLKNESQVFPEVIHKITNLYFSFKPDIINDRAWEYAFNYIIYSIGLNAKKSPFKTSISTVLENKAIYDFFNKKSILEKNHPNIIDAIIILDLANLKVINHQLAIEYKQYFQVSSWDKPLLSNLSENERLFLYKRSISKTITPQLNLNFRQQILEYSQARIDTNQIENTIFNEYVVLYNEIIKENEATENYYEDEIRLRLLLPLKLQTISLDNLKEIRITYLIHRSQFLENINEGLFSIDNMQIASFLKDILISTKLTVDEILMIICHIEKTSISSSNNFSNSSFPIPKLKDFIKRDLNNYGITEHDYIDRIIKSFSSNFSANYRFTKWSPFKPILNIEKLQTNIQQELKLTSEQFKAIYMTIDFWTKMIDVNIKNNLYHSLRHKVKLEKHSVISIINLYNEGWSISDIKYWHSKNELKSESENVELIINEYTRILLEIYNSTFINMLK